MPADRGGHLVKQLRIIDRCSDDLCDLGEQHQATSFLTFLRYIAISFKDDNAVTRPEDLLAALNDDLAFVLRRVGDLTLPEVLPHEAIEELVRSARMFCLQELMAH